MATPSRARHATYRAHDIPPLTSASPLRQAAATPASFSSALNKFLYACRTIMLCWHSWRALAFYPASHHTGPSIDDATTHKRTAGTRRATGNGTYAVHACTTAHAHCWHHHLYTPTQLPARRLRVATARTPAALLARGGNVATACRCAR